MTHRWRTGTVKSGGEQIYYEVTGEPDAPAFLLSHGAGGSHAAWYQQVPAFADAGYQVITWDCRGFGNSSYSTGVHGADAAVADMDAVLDAAGVNDAHVAGQSMGGWWVTAFALAHPERVRTLILSNTVGGLWTDAIDAHFKSFVASAADAGESRLGVHSALGPSFVDRDPARAFLYQQLNTFHTPPMGDVVNAITAHVTHADLDALHIPILVITGSDDILFPAPLVCDSVSRLQNAQIVEVPGVGHSLYFEDPASYNGAVLEFVAEVGA